VSRGFLAQALIGGGALALSACVFLLAEPSGHSQSQDDQGRGGVVVAPDDHSPCWAPGGDTVYFTSSRGRLDNEAGYAVFAVQADGTRLRRVSPWGFELPNVSPSGSRLLVLDLACSMRNRRVCWCLLDLGSGRITRLDTGAKRGYSHLTFGASDTVLVFARKAGSRPTADIYALEVALESGTIVREWNVLRDEAPADRPEWSPDGSKVAYVADPHYLGDTLEQYAVRVQLVAGDEQRNEVLRAPVGDHVSSIRWFADSRRLLVCTRLHWWIVDTATAQASDYRALLLDAGNLTQSTIDELRGPAPCLDGSDRILVSIARRKGAKRIGHYVAVMDFDGSSFRQITFDDDGTTPYVFPKQQPARQSQ